MRLMGQGLDVPISRPNGFLAPPMAPLITSLSAAEARALLPQLHELLHDAVDSGASVGFLPPLAAAESESYWHSVIAAIEAGHRLLLVARGPDSGDLLAAVQLDLATRPQLPAAGRSIEAAGAPAGAAAGPGPAAAAGAGGARPPAGAAPRWCSTPGRATSPRSFINRWATSSWALSRRISSTSMGSRTLRRYIISC